jgi:hypothetical protein
LYGYANSGLKKLSGEVQHEYFDGAFVLFQSTGVFGVFIFLQSKHVALDPQSGQLTEKGGKHANLSAVKSHLSGTKRYYQRQKFKMYSAPRTRFHQCVDGYRHNR